ncbi:MAG: DUF2461 domain-containing protein [Saprospiraceae bacterium]|nr:DUF2461 domain-containing protein [Saprospiraceae bacterium]
MSYFTRDFLNFFADLRLNNDREWFQANKPRYEKAVKLPLEQFIAHAIDRLHLIDATFHTTTKESIFRIYRDTRFSNDKTPYKSHASAVLSKYGRKESSAGVGLYLELSDEGLSIYSGVYQPDTKQLKNIREAIAAHAEIFTELIQAPDFVSKFGGTIHGERAKRLPKELAEAAIQQPLIYNKAFYYFHTFEPDTILQPNLLELVVEYYQAAQPLGDFLKKAIEEGA